MGRHRRRQRRRRRDARARAGDHRGTHPDPGTRRLRSARGSELESAGGLDGSPLPHRRALARWRRSRVPAVHALLRRRQLEVLGRGPLPDARGGLRRHRACRRRVARLADRLRHARAVLREGRAVLPRARGVRLGSDRAAARHLSVSGRAPRPAYRAAGRTTARNGAPPVAVAARLVVSGDPLHPLHHVQLVSLLHRCEVGGGAVRRPAGNGAWVGPRPDRRPRPTTADRPVGPAGDRGRGGTERGDRAVCRTGRRRLVAAP